MFFVAKFYFIVVCVAAPAAPLMSIDYRDMKPESQGGNALNASDTPVQTVQHPITEYKGSHGS